MLWYQCTLFLNDTDTTLNRIIYERYYCQEDVIYYRTNDIDKEIFNPYLTQGLIPTYAKLKYYGETASYINACDLVTDRNNVIMYSHRYVRNDDRSYYCFYNENLEESIEFPKEIFETLRDSRED